MKILVIGSGGREHALVHTFARQGHTVFCHPGNPGIRTLAEPLAKNLSVSDHAALALAVKQKGIELTVVGPEAELERGIADYFASEKLPLFGPKKGAARLESSKAWAKDFMQRHKIPTASFTVCHNAADARNAALSLFAQGKGVVVKPSGLTGGKGVVCCATMAEAEAAISDLFEEKKYGDSGQEAVVEEYLSGPEISLQVFCDGQKMIPMLAAQDHKRLLDDNEGPNTGGMGAYAPVQFVSPGLQKKIRTTIIDPTCRGLQLDGIDYRGVLYFGLMLTPDGPKVLEYNCRFGDPEAEALLPLIQTDLANVMIACLNGRLDRSLLRWKSLASCSVILAARGYPDAPIKGFPVKELEMFENRKNLIIFHSGTALNAYGELVTSGGRVLAITGLGSTLEKAIAVAYEAARSLPASWAVYRSDIGKVATMSCV